MTDRSIEQRPRISRQEIGFLLELLRQAEANVNHECLSLSEEAEQLEIRVSALRSRLRLGDYSVIRELRESGNRLQCLKFRAVPSCDRSIDHVFDRAHVNVSVDPMRIVTVPNTVNGKTGLVCCFIGDAKDLEGLSISELLDQSKDFAKFHSYPEPLESPLSKESPNGVMKQCDQNQVRAA